MKKIAPGSITAQRQFEQAGNSPDAWQSVANNLLAAANLLIDRSRTACLPLSEGLGAAPDPARWQLPPVAFMLRGMAVECLLKSFWLSGGPPFIVEGKFRPVPGAKHHNLLALASTCEFTVDPVESNLLQRLSHFVQYGGRYPVPKDAQKLNLLLTPDGGFASAATWSSPSDDVAFDALVLRLQQVSGA